MKKLLVIATTLTLGLAGIASASWTTVPLHHTRQAGIPALTLTLRSGRQARGCTRDIPDRLHVAVWVAVNGHDLQASTTSGPSMYYGADGTLVKLTPVHHNGPICSRAMTWLHHARVRVTFRVFSSTPQ